ncbi:MAG: hypothetical protein QOJ29_2987, partial [Thermoleophilaceae bacterium]|nr:hypothetical protein [Thermoleophilaceae bacterium]
MPGVDIFDVLEAQIDRSAAV